MAPRRQKPIPPQQGGLFCRTCGVPLISPDEQRQQECDRCYDLFAPEPTPPASPASPEPIADDLAAAWLQVEREAGDYPALTQHAGVWLVAIGLESFERAWAAIRSGPAHMTVDIFGKKYFPGIHPAVVVVCPDVVPAYEAILLLTPPLCLPTVVLPSPDARW